MSIACFNSTGIACTKYASAAQRSTIDTSRTLTIWLLSLALGLETFHPWEIPGFILLAAGTLLYNEIVVFPYWGFDQYTKDKIAERAAAEGRVEARNEYVATSPGAAYDSKRKERALQAKLDERDAALVGGEDTDFGMTQNFNDGVQNRSTADPDNSGTNFQ